MKISLTKSVAVFFILVWNATPTVNQKEKRRHFKIQLYEEASALQFIRSANGTIIGYSGALYESLEWIARRLKFTYTVVPYDDYKMVLLPNGTWTGSLVPLLRKEVDYMFNAILLSHVTAQYVEFSATYNEEPLVLYTAPPREESRLLAPVKPFTLTVWLALLATMLFMSWGTYCIFFAEKRLGRKVSRRKIQKPDDVLEGLWRVLMGQGGFPEIFYSSLAKRICVAVWCLAAIILVNGYTSSFISYATAPKLIYPATTLDEVAFRTNLQLVLVGTNRLPFFYNASAPAFNILGKQIEKNPENILSRHRLLTGRIATGCCVSLLHNWMLNYLLLLDYQNTGQCRATITKEPQGWEHYSLVGQKGDPFMKNISKEVLWNRAYGFLEYSFYSQLKVAQKCLTHDPPSVRPLKLSDLTSVFLILFFGYLLSIVVFVGEILSGRFRMRKRRPA